jgi:hypothetical protein
MIQTVRPEVTGQAGVASSTSETMLTLEQLAEFLTRAGFPITKRYLAQLSVPSVNAGPPCSCKWGTRKLFRPSEALVWAKNRCKPYSPEAA